MRKLLALLVVLATMGGYAPEIWATEHLTEDEDIVTGDVPAVVITADPYEEDPIEDVNRAVFGFNEAIDNALIEPVARFYRGILPEYARERVTDTLNNLGEPSVFINNIVQGDVDGIFITFWRFFINSTIGIGGLYDVASEVGLKPKDKDFAQTMGAAGVESGPYIVLPIFGPSTPRHAAGVVVDTLVNPFSYLTWPARIGIVSAKVVDKREHLLDLTDEIEETSFDPYATMRSAYRQRREDFIEQR